MTFGLGLSYGPQASLYAEMFPANVRYSGVSIGYALGAILGGAFAPMIAEALISSTGQVVDDRRLHRRGRADLAGGRLAGQGDEGRRPCTRSD